MVYNWVIKENFFMLKYIFCDIGVGDFVESGGGVFIEGEGNVEGGFIGGFFLFVGGIDGEIVGVVNGVLVGKMFYNFV